MGTDCIPIGATGETPNPGVIIFSPRGHSVEALIRRCCRLYRQPLRFSGTPRSGDALPVGWADYDGGHWNICGHEISNDAVERGACGRSGIETETENAVENDIERGLCVGIRQRRFVSASIGFIYR